MPSIHPRGVAQRLHDQLATRIRNDLAALPAGSQADLRVSTLARRYLAGVISVRRALHALARQGVVEIVRGRPARAPKSAPAGTLRIRPDARGRVSEALRADILAGLHPTGKPLPKLRALAARYRTSTSTIRSVLTELEHAGFLFSDGRMMIPGRPTRGGIGRCDSSRIILVIEQSFNEWVGLRRRDRLDSFYHRFTTDAEHHGIKLHIFTIDKPGFFGRPAESSLNDLASVYRDCGKRLLGSLLVGARLSSPAFWARLQGEVGSAGQPWLCLNEKPSVHGLLPCAPSMVPACCSEQHAIACLLDHLAAQGHRRVGLLRGTGASWIKRRWSLLRRMAEERYPRIAICEEPERPSTIGLPSIGRTRVRAQFARRIIDLWPSARPRVHNLGRLDSLLESMDWTNPDARSIATEMYGFPNGILAFEGLFELSYRLLVTALVSPDDWHARKYKTWLVHAGVESRCCPELCSFDNLPENQSWGISEVDFGYGSLAAKVVRYFSGEVPRDSLTDGGVLYGSPSVASFQALPGHG